MARAEGSWQRPVGGAVALEYGRTWIDAQGRSCTHGGLDLLGSAGATVRACGSGEVVFAGLVPACEGARAYAVTVLTPDGLKVTYLPLASASVRRGQQVPGGGILGQLAGSGDGSSAQSHLHLGVKRGSAALDPAGFLAPPTPVLPPTPRPAPQPQPRPAPHPAPQQVPHPVPVPLPVPHLTPQTSPQRSYGSVRAPAASPSAADATKRAAQGAASALALLAPLTRVEAAATPAQLDLERAGTDIAAGRSALLAVGIRVGLVLLAGVCVIPVLRSARKAAAQGVPAVARRERS
jgi:hypothetical protein